VEIHLKDSNIDLSSSHTVQANCGKRLVQIKLAQPDLNQGQVCQKCLEVHNDPLCKGKKFTYAYEDTS